MSGQPIGISQWVQRIKAEYEEMPGLSLSRAQMQRLWGLDASACEALVEALIAARVLRYTRHGTYVSFGKS